VSERDTTLDRAREEIFNALRFLAPDEAERILREMADAMKKLASKYDDLLAEAIL
jgi:hypothetical protein